VTIVARLARLAGVALVLAWTAPAEAAVWQQLCPDGALCSGTPDSALVRDGSVLLGFTDRNGVSRRQWLSLDTGEARNAGVVCGIALPEGRCFNGNATGGAVYAADGTVLYTFNPSGMDAVTFTIAHGTLVGGVVRFEGTSPPTIVTGINTGGGGTTLYLTWDEGRTWQAQKPNVSLAGGSLLLSPDGSTVWASTREPLSNGLWRLPPLGQTSGAADFTHLVRIDDGSYPGSVRALRSVLANAALPGGYVIAVAADGMYVSTDLGRHWERSAFADPVDDVVFAFEGNPDVQVIAARESVFASRDRGQTWSELAKGLPASHYGLGADNGRIVASGNGVFGCRALDCDGAAFAKVYPFGIHFTQVAEFYNTALDHYFITGDEGEKYYVRIGGAGPGWIETGQSFWAWSPTWPVAAAFVCRYYGDPLRGPNSHFYSGSAAECKGLLNRAQLPPDGLPRWNSEGYVFKVALPVNFRCATNLVPVWRAYNNGYARGSDSNHRYVLDPALLEPLRVRGWITEGIVFCVPPAPA
jgi:hypothetical protein